VSDQTAEVLWGCSADRVGSRLNDLVLVRWSERRAKRQRRATPYRAGVYLLFRDGDVVYVGQSKDVHERVDTHRRVFDHAFISYVPHGLLLIYEAVLIRAFRPKFNKSRGPFVGVKIENEIRAEFCLPPIADDEVGELESLRLRGYYRSVLKDGVLVSVPRPRERHGCRGRGVRQLWLQFTAANTGR
jgi:hypothetical protein